MSSTSNRCNQCNASVPINFDTCPNCGSPSPHARRSLLIKGIAILIVIIGITFIVSKIIYSPGGM